MKNPIMITNPRHAIEAVACCGLLLAGSVAHAENSYEGLWVGRVALSHVNEVSIPLDEENIPIAPDPNVPTPAHDEAYLRLILHVNGAGQVNLLKDVAILKQDEGASGTITGSESDYVLVTDDRLYADFPAQEAVRIASAVFDFGDSKATDAVDDLIDAIIDEVAPSVLSNNLSSASEDGELRQAEDDAQAVAEAAADLVVVSNDVAGAFGRYLLDNLPSATLTTIATTEPLDLDDLRDKAVELRDASFYSDSRAINMLADMEAAVANAPDADAKEAAAHNVVSRYADTANEYQRFINGRSVGDMIVDAAQAAGVAAVSNAPVRAAVNAVPSVQQVRLDAPNAQDKTYDDTAATSAVETVLDAVINSAASNTATQVSDVADDAEAAGLNALQNDVPRYALQTQAPTTDYTDFIRSDAYLDAVETASEAAALAAVKEAKNDPFHDETTLRNAAKLGAVNALRNVYGEAARARQTELPMAGEFGVGLGDPRLVSTIASTNAPLASSGALTATLLLPASHPTNPFRHRRHPDHTVGLDIQRDIRIDFDGDSTNQLERVSIGVDQISGTYREEIFGLHKPLGPNPDSNPVGLKVEGKFELNRISHIDTLNAL